MQYEEVTHNTITDTKVNLWGTSGIAARNNEIFSSDAHGNTDEAHGTTTKRYIYDAYGNQINENENDDNPYRYCGENYDEETGLYYLRARYYDPSIGRFLSEDPAQDGVNWYVYANNNPVMFVDPNGEDAIVVTNRNVVAKQGHISAIYQDKDGNWFYTYWGNKATAVIHIPDEYMGSIGDFNNELNKFLSDKQFVNITSDYTDATYIVGDFTASLDAAYKDVSDVVQNSFGKLTTFKDGSKVFQGTNKLYGALNNNCLQRTYDSLSKGILKNSWYVGQYMEDLGIDRGIIPVNYIQRFEQAFMNNSFTKSGAYGGLYNYSYYYNNRSVWAQRWEKAHYANAVIR